MELYLNFELLVYRAWERQLYRESVGFLFQMTQLKIDNNPFAKSFRITGARRREKK